MAAAIEKCGGQYFVGGSLASAFQGEPRATNDVDLVVDLPVSRIAALANELGPDFQVDMDMVRDAFLRRSSCNIFFLPSVLKIDLFAVGTGPYDQSEFARRKKIQIRPNGDALVLKTPEDSVLRKLLWFQDGGGVSNKQWRDVVQLIKINASLDREYMDTWALRLGITGLLEKARDEAS